MRRNQGAAPLSVVDMDRKRLGALAAMLGTLAYADHSAAEDQYWARRSKKMVEHSHDVKVKVAPGHAELVVRRTVYNGGERNDEANFDIYVPVGAVAVGLRTLALKDGAPHWYAGDLMEAEAAAAKYLELTGIGGAYPKDPALLSWRDLGHLRLQVFPCPPQANKSVEYTLLLPTEYRGGKHVVTLPRMGSKAVAPELRLAQAAGKLFVGGKPAQPGDKLAVGPDGTVEVALAAGHAPALGGALAAVEAGDAAALNRFRLEAAPKLTATPRNARVVILIDVSRSLEEVDVHAARKAALAYLSHLPDARVEVVTFARTAKRRHGRFVSAKQAINDLKGATLTRDNGSFVDEALMLADGLLKKGEGPARMVLFTDQLTRTALAPDHLRAMLGGHALLHVVVPRDASQSSLVRHDDDWTAITRSTGGLVWHAHVAGASSRDVFEELVRPIRIHNFAMASSEGMSIDGCDVPSELSEGESVTCSDVGEQTASWVAATGELWTEPVRVRLEPDTKESDRWAALVFGHSDHNLLTEEQMMGVALRGKAVSPVTSYLAIEPGVRPSTDGLEHGAAGGFGWVGPIRYGATGVSGKKPAFDGKAFLTHAIATSWLACGGAGKRAHVELETTLAEVVDVTRVEAKDVTAEQLVCLREAPWALALPAAFELPHAQWSIDI